MAETKKDSTNDFIKKLAEFKNGKLTELSNEISREKGRVSSLISAIKAKHSALEAKKAEQEARAKAEAEQVAPEPPKKEEPKSEEPAKAQGEKPSRPEPKPEQKPEPKPEPKPEQKPKQDAPKPEKPQVELGADGKPRRVFTPTPEPPKKPNVVTKVFGNGGYQGSRGPKPTQGQPRQNGQNPNGPRRPLGSNLGNIPQPLPPKTGGQKGKGGKQTQSNNGRNYDDRSSLNKRALQRKGYTVDDNITYDENGEEVKFGSDMRSRSNRSRNNSSVNAVVIESAVITTDPVPIKTLSEKIGKTGTQIVSALFTLGTFKTINDSIDFETAELIADEFGIKLKYKPDVTLEDTLTARLEVDEVEDLDNLVERPPIVTIMGHVDHGKTSLLDYIRKTNVTGGEAGGITQHIGAYTATLNGKPITFLDTPGHEAFTSMRARGAQVTDIAVLVVAADDGIMPQTIEAINHARQANVPIIVALNKMDKPGANPDRAMQQLAEQGVTPEEWGGETPVVKVSAKTGMGVENLLEQILVRAEIEELRANPNRPARGTIIEAKLDKGMGKIATILVQTGTLHVGDNVVAGVCTGKIRMMINAKGDKVKTAGPSTPVSVTGWNDVPEAGDRIDVVSDERFARELAEERKLRLASAQTESAAVSLNDLFDKISKGELKSVKLIIKADVQGSVEAVKQSLAKLGNEEVTIDIIHSAVGGIKESDVLLAETAGAIIIGFNVRPDANAKALAAQKKIDIRFYDIIYNAIEDIQKAVKGMLAPKFKEVALGSAQIRMVYKITGVGNVAGCYVLDGKVTRNAKARLVRDGAVLYNGEVASLRHGKEDVREMARGYECGITLKNYQDFKEGDIIEAYSVEQINED